MKMWSKTRKILLSRIAPSLQGRINFIREEFTTKKLKYWSTSPVFRVTVDKKTWFAVSFEGFLPVRFMQRELVGNNKKLAVEIGDTFWKQNEEKGYHFWAIEDSLHRYLNLLSLDE